MGAGGIGADTYNGSIINNLIIDNYSFQCGGGVGFRRSSPTLINNTIVANSAPGLGGGVGGEISTGVLTNNIIRGNSASGGAEIGVGAGCTLDIGYCNVNMTGVYIDSYGSVNWGPGNIDADALFVPGPLGDYYLSQIAAGQGADSPCVDAGDPLSPVITGTTRTDEAQDTWIVDMGYHSLP